MLQQLACFPVSSHLEFKMSMQRVNTRHVIADAGSAMEFLKDESGPNGSVCRCTICNKWFGRKFNAMRHMETQHMVPNWVNCRYCRTQLRNKYALYHHERKCVKNVLFDH